MELHKSKKQSGFEEESEDRQKCISACPFGVTGTISGVFFLFADAHVTAKLFNMTDWLPRAMIEREDARFQTDSRLMGSLIAIILLYSSQFHANG